MWSMNLCLSLLQKLQDGLDGCLMHSTLLRSVMLKHVSTSCWALLCHIQLRPTTISGEAS
jgi:hypothetical protein